MPSGIKYLDWDSRFFGFKVGVTYALPDEREWIELLKMEEYRLVYIFIDPDDNKSRVTANKSGALLVDTKITYELDLKQTYILQDISVPGITISEFEGEKADPKLYDLAFQSGEYSRFRTDKFFPPQSFEALYRLWIDRSLNKEFASHVIVARCDGQIAGFSTLSIQGSTAKIGLFAVDKMFRGKKIGKSIISYIIQLLNSEVIVSIEVTAQNKNRNACLFYESCGFSVKKREWIYHYWLNK